MCPLEGEGDQQEENSSQFGHVDQNNISVHERIVIDKSSVEEAKSSKAKMDQLETMANLNIDGEVGLF